METVGSSHELDCVACNGASIGTLLLADRRYAFEVAFTRCDTTSSTSKLHSWPSSAVRALSAPRALSLSVRVLTYYEDVLVYS